MSAEFNYAVAGLSGITESALVEKVRNCIKMATGNAAFPSPVPSLVSLTATSDALDTSQQSYKFTRSKLDKDARDTHFATLKGMMHEYVGYVQSTSNGDSDLILSMGLDLRRKPKASVLPEAPARVVALVTPYPGRIEVRWGGVPQRHQYGLYVADTADGPWTLVTWTGKTRYTLDDLQSDKTYYFRVIAQGAAGASPASDIAKAKAA